MLAGISGSGFNKFVKCSPAYSLCEYFDYTYQGYSDMTYTGRMVFDFIDGGSKSFAEFGTYRTRQTANRMKRIRQYCCGNLAQCQAVNLVPEWPRDKCASSPNPFPSPPPVEIDLAYGQYGHRQLAHTQPSPEEENFDTKVPLGNSQDRTRIRTLDRRLLATPRQEQTQSEKLSFSRGPLTQTCALTCNFIEHAH
jgi:hypothetical protein